MRSGAAWGKEVMVEIFWLSCEPPVASARWSSWKRLCVGWDISLIMSLLTWGCIWCIKSLFMLPLCVRQPLHLFFFFSFLEGLMWSTVFVRWIRHNEAVHKDVIQHTKLHSFVAQSDISYLGLNSFLVIFLLHKSIVVWHRNIICVYFVGELQVASLSIQFLWCSD